MFNDTQFLQDVVRTESPNYFAENIPQPILKSAMNDYIGGGQDLDIIKKSMFYGKELPEMGIIFDEENMPVIGKVESRIAHGIIGVATEATELVEALFKPMIEDKELDMTNVKEEIGDLLYYLSVLCDALGTDFSTEGNRVINKLKSRYPEKFTLTDSDNRDVVKERKILEQE